MEEGGMHCILIFLVKVLLSLLEGGGFAWKSHWKGLKDIFERRNWMISNGESVVTGYLQLDLKWIAFNQDNPSCIVTI